MTGPASDARKLVTFALGCTGACTLRSGSWPATTNLTSVEATLDAHGITAMKRFGRV